MTSASTKTMHLFPVHYRIPLLVKVVPTMHRRFHHTFIVVFVLNRWRSTSWWRSTRWWRNTRWRSMHSSQRCFYAPGDSSRTDLVVGRSNWTLGSVARQLHCLCTDQSVAMSVSWQMFIVTGRQRSSLPQWCLTPVEVKQSFDPARNSKVCCRKQNVRYHC